MGCVAMSSVFADLNPVSNHPVEHTGAGRYANNSLQPQMIPKQYMRVPVMSQMSSQGIIPHFAHIPYYMYTPHVIYRQSSQSYLHAVKERHDAG